MALLINGIWMEIYFKKSRTFVSFSDYKSPAPKIYGVVFLKCTLLGLISDNEKTKPDHTQSNWESICLHFIAKCPKVIEHAIFNVPIYVIFPKTSNYNAFESP